VVARSDIVLERPNLRPEEAMPEASDYSGRVDLFNGEFREHGGGLTANVYAETERDVVVLDVRGADPKELQTAELRLWAPRRPNRAQSSGMALLSEIWLDDKAAGASGKTFGSLAALRFEATTSCVLHLRGSRTGMPMAEFTYKGIAK
jgi:hypothetical protein